MAETTNYQCPNCSGRLSFNSGSGQLECEFCGAAFTAAQLEELYGAKQAAADAQAAGTREADAAAQGATTAAAASVTSAAQVEHKPVQLTGDPVKDYLSQSKPATEGMGGMQGYNCPSCGAQLMVDAVTAVTSCPYCGNNTVVPGQLSDVLKPDVIIPFKLDKDAAITALRNYYKGKRFLPNSFTNENHLQEIQGVYVPFWLYSGQGQVDATFNAENVRTWSDARNVYTETDHYVLRRAGTMEFDRVPVDGSTRMPDAHMDAIEPFDYSELVPFSMNYLPGYVTDRYDQNIDDCKQRATNRACATCESAIQETAGGYMSTTLANVRSGMKWEQFTYALLPVWMLHTKWKGEDFLFAMNGQTGKLIGDLPVDNGKVVRRFATVFAIAFLVVAAALYVLFWL